MGKAKASRKGSSERSSPYAKAEKSTRAIFSMNKQLGQNLLKNPKIAETIVEKAGLKPTDVVLEIGPGTGNLTVRILEKAKRVIAIEFDPRMAAEVSKRVMGTPFQKKLEVLLGDAIKLDFPTVDVCISNTPYQISSPLVFKLLSHPNPPRVSILMFQLEFAQRLLARPGDPLYSRLSVNAQFFAKITHILKVGRNNFRPPPQVDSSVVRIEMLPNRPQVSFAEWDGMLRVCFVRKNRVLRASWLGQKEVVNMVEKNYKTWCAMNGIPFDDQTIVTELDGEDERMDIDGEEVGEEDEWGGIMDDDDTPAFFKEEITAKAKGQVEKTRSKRNKTAGTLLVREKIRKVLEDKTGLAEKRAGKCDENDFLKLLLAFNEEGIHFA